MRFDQFEQLTEAEASKLLDDFLDSEEKHISVLLAQSGPTKGFPPYSIEALPHFLSWVLHQVQIRTIAADDSVPDWIRETPDYKNSLFEFDEFSRSIIVAAAFYLGETFVRSFDQLSWGLGDRETALCNMPVVKGFDDDEELPPLLVLENVFSRIISCPDRSGDIDRMVQRWVSQVS